MELPKSWRRKTVEIITAHLILAKFCSTLSQKVWDVESSELEYRIYNIGNQSHSDRIFCIQVCNHCECYQYEAITTRKHSDQQISRLWIVSLFVCQHSNLWEYHSDVKKVYRIMSHAIRCHLQNFSHNSNEKHQ